MKENIIYHYCSMESFFGIITNKNIRLSSAYKTNDYYELEWIFNVMEKSLNSIFKKEFISSLRKSYREWMENYFRPHIFLIVEPDFFKQLEDFYIKRETKNMLN